MARHYVIQDWSNSATWSGEMIGDRLSKSKGHHFLKNGMANTEMYAGDEEEDFKKKSRVPIKNRILPQAARLDKLQAEIVELEEAYRSGEFSLKDYTLLRDVAFAKKARAEILYMKAIAAKPTKTEEEADELPSEMTYSSCDVDYSNTPTAPSNWLDDLIAELPERNCFKNFLRIACKVTRKAVEFSQATKQYIKTLSEV